MDIKEQISIIQDKFHVSYKEARFMVKAHLRKLYEDGDITKAEWKNAKAVLKEELQ